MLEKSRAEAQRLAARGAPEYMIPGAYSERGPEHEDYVNNDDTTVMVGSRDNENDESPEELPMFQAVDAHVVAKKPPLVQAEVDTSCTRRDRRLQVLTALVMILAIVGVALGLVFGLQNDKDEPTNVPATTPAPAGNDGSTPSPTTDSPVSLTWAQAGSLGNIQGTSGGSVLSMSPDGSLFSVLDGTSVQVYQEDGSQVGEPIVALASSLSLSNDRLAVGTLDSSNTTTTIGQVSVFRLSSNEWSLVGSPIIVEGWTVILSKDGTVLAVETADSVQVYQEMNNEWKAIGSSIPTESIRIDQGPAFSRVAMSSDGMVLLVDLSIYSFENEQWAGGVRLGIESYPPDTPVSMSGDGRVVAIAQPQSTINGLNSGQVTVFEFDGVDWVQSGNDIIGDGQVNGFFGYSHALSGDGNRISVMNNALDDSQNRALVFHLEGSQWIRLLEEVPQAVSDGTLVMSEDGKRVAVGGQGIVRLYDIVEK